MSEMSAPRPTLRQPCCTYSRPLRVMDCLEHAQHGTSGEPADSDVVEPFGQRRDGPCVDGPKLSRNFSTLQPWSEQPCVRPVDAVHMTAGHNALRGPGPGHNLAFIDAVALVGCPDHRIDRSALRAVGPFQLSRLTARSHGRLRLSNEQAQPVLDNFHPLPSSPTPCGQVCWPVRSQQPSLAYVQVNC